MNYEKWKVQLRVPRSLDIITYGPEPSIKWPIFAGIELGGILEQQVPVPVTVTFEVGMPG
jgi:hypothetical protein